MTNVKGPIISFADLPSIEAYLSAHEGSQSGFWLKLAKAVRQKQPSPRRRPSKPLYVTDGSMVSLGRLMSITIW
jgi:hypothetical protein